MPWSHQPRQIDDPVLAGPHDHTVWFGDGPNELHRLARDALAAGARRGNKLIFIADDPDPEQLRPFEEMDRLLGKGQLEVLAVDSVYPPGATLGARDQLNVFEGVLEAALSLGYRGLDVVADNTRLASGGEEAYRRWLAWELVCDRFQAVAPVTGFCYFNRRALREERQVTLAAVHRVRSSSTPEPPFTLTARDAARAITGNLDRFSAEHFHQVIAAAPEDEPLVLDVRGTEFVDHRALFTLASAATFTRPVILRHARPVLKKLVPLLGITTPYLSFE